MSQPRPLLMKCGSAKTETDGETPKCSQVRGQGLISSLSPILPLISNNIWDPGCVASPGPPLLRAVNSSTLSSFSFFKFEFSWSFSVRPGMLPNLHRLELIICMTHCEPPCSLLLGRDFLFPLRPMGRLVEGLPKRTQPLWGLPLSPLSGPRAQWVCPGLGWAGAELGLSWLGGWVCISQLMCSWRLRLLTAEAGDTTVKIHYVFVPVWMWLFRGSGRSW